LAKLGLGNAVGRRGLCSLVPPYDGARREVLECWSGEWGVGSGFAHSRSEWATPARFGRDGLMHPSLGEGRGVDATAWGRPVFPRLRVGLV